MRHRQSDYLHWAKTQSRLRYNLATSGVGAFPFGDLHIDCSKLELHGDNRYGYAPLQCAIARRYGVDPDSVVEAAGTSMANHLAMAALIEPGDEILIEHPAYGPLLDAALYLEADVKRFAREEQDGYTVDPAQIRRAMTPRTRLIVLTNLHNPSSVLTPESVLREVGDIARGGGARVLVDEVYLDAVYEETPATAFRLGPEFVVTSSLTKVYGLSGLRCGWILAEPALAHRMHALNNLYGSLPVHVGELLSVAAFEHLDSIRERARRVVEADRAVLTGFLDRQNAASAVRTRWGTTCFLCLPHGSAAGGGDEFVERLRRDYETSVVPGRFFEMPDHFRIGMGVDTEMFGEGLRRIEKVLEAG